MIKRNINIGDRFHRLEVIGFDEKTPKNILLKVKCDCGTVKTIIKGTLFSKTPIKSCGCYRKNLKTTHGHGHTRINNIWSGITTRIKNKNRPEYKYYGARGLTMSKSWLKFENFYKDMGQSYEEHCKMHGEKNTTLDRINSNKGYSKQNCKWSTYKEQNSNKRNNIKYKGETATEASYRLTNGENQWLVFGRLKRGWSLKDAFTKVSKKRS